MGRDVSSYSDLVQGGKERESGGEHSEAATEVNEGQTEKGTILTDLVFLEEARQCLKNVLGIVSHSFQAETQTEEFSES